MPKHVAKMSNLALAEALEAAWPTEQFKLLHLLEKRLQKGVDRNRHLIFLREFCCYMDAGAYLEAVIAMVRLVKGECAYSVAADVNGDCKAWLRDGTKFWHSNISHSPALALAAALLKALHPSEEEDVSLVSAHGQRPDHNRRAFPQALAAALKRHQRGRASRSSR